MLPMPLFHLATLAALPKHCSSRRRLAPFWNDWGLASKHTILILRYTDVSRRHPQLFLTSKAEPWQTICSNPGAVFRLLNAISDINDNTLLHVILLITMPPISAPISLKLKLLPVHRRGSEDQFMNKLRMASYVDESWLHNFCSPFTTWTLCCYSHAHFLHRLFSY